MTTDLLMLVWTALLSLLFPLTYTSGIMQSPGGMQWSLGNRDTAVDAPAWTARAKRAHANLIENLAPFAILVLVAHVAGKANGTTALGASLFFWARVAHAAIYIAGIPGVRTGAYAVGLIGELLILFQLLG